MLEVILVIGIIALALFFFVEAYFHKKEAETNIVTAEIASDFIDAFNEVKSVINVNASTLRTLKVGVERHEKMIEILSAVSDVHARAMNIDPNLREKLESQAIIDLPVGEVVESEEQEPSS